MPRNQRHVPVDTLTHKCCENMVAVIIKCKRRLRTSHTRDLCLRFVLYWYRIIDFMMLRDVNLNCHYHIRRLLDARFKI